jgi:hypothetical protein
VSGGGDFEERTKLFIECSSCRFLAGDPSVGSSSIMAAAQAKISSLILAVDHFPCASAEGSARPGKKNPPIKVKEKSKPEELVDREHRRQGGCPSVGSSYQQLQVLKNLAAKGHESAPFDQSE